MSDNTRAAFVPNHERMSPTDQSRSWGTLKLSSRGTHLLIDVWPDGYHRMRTGRIGKTFTAKELAHMAGILADLEQDCQDRDAKLVEGKKL